jgi:protein phosphatase-4 regulatory subunit 3
LRSNRFRRDAKALEEDEEMWFNEDDDEEGKAVITPVEKSKTEDDFPDSYEKFMETKKGTNVCNFHISPLSKTIIQPEFDP